MKVHAALKSPEAAPDTIDADIAACDVNSVPDPSSFAVSSIGCSSSYPASFRFPLFVLAVIG